MWQPPRQQYCQDVCQMLERLKKCKPEYPGFQTSQGLVVRRPSASWIERKDQPPPRKSWKGHCSDVIMNEMASQITSISIFNSTAYSGADQRKHQSSASLAFVWGIHRGPVNSPHKGLVMRKCFHLMTSSWGTIAPIMQVFKFRTAIKISPDHTQKNCGI